MDGIWNEDGTFEVAKGKGTSRVKGLEKGKRKGKGKGKKGKDGEPPSKRQRVDGEENNGDEDLETEEQWYEREWKDKQVCLFNLKAAALNGIYGKVTKNMGIEKILGPDGKEKKIRRFTVNLEGGKGEKSIKMENLFKVMTGALVKLRGLDSSELNDTIAECGRLDAKVGDNLRYDVTLSDGRHLKVKPSNVELLARYETSKVAGDQEQKEWVKNANGLHGILSVIEWFEYPIPNVIPAGALAEYATKFPKSIVIGQSKAGNPKGIEMLRRDVTSSQLVPANSRIVFISMPRERNCISPALTDLRHDELLRIGKFASWVVKRCSPRPVYFMLPSMVAKGPASLLNSATCAWPLYLTLCTDVVAVDSDRWHKSYWARLDALLGAVWGRKPLYLLPEKYQIPVELGDAAPVSKEEDLDEDVQNDAKTCPFSFRAEEPFTVERPTEGSSGVALIASLAERGLEAEGADTKHVLKPCLAAKRLG